MESDPTKLGTMKLMGTFGVPSYISFGDEYMKKIRASARDPWLRPRFLGGALRRSACGPVRPCNAEPAQAERPDRAAQAG